MLEALIEAVEQRDQPDQQSAARHQPQRQAADADGYVLLPNVKPLLEMMDLSVAWRWPSQPSRADSS